MKKPYEVVKHHPTESHVYREGKVEHLDSIVARVLKLRGVVKGPITEARVAELQGEPGPSETPEAGPEETKGGDGFDPDWVERAKAALAPSKPNGNTVRSILAEVAETSQYKAQNIDALAKLVATAEKVKG